MKNLIAHRLVCRIMLSYSCVQIISVGSDVISNRLIFY